MVGRDFAFWARARDRGETWEDLGIILEAPPGWHDCSTPNQYFVGGVGDVSVLLDRDSKDLYLYFSQYSKYAPAQGVALARLAWADRDAPAGKVSVFNAGAWLPATRVTIEDESGATSTDWTYSDGTPLVPVTQPWHDDPAAWTTPTKIVDGGSWYPQVMGIETGEGSDKQAGARARLFLGGRSTQFIEFNAR